jgi:hypothetical protein
MKPFDYNKYRKHNVLLNENFQEGTNPESEAYDFISKNYKKIIAPAIQKMLIEFDKEFPDATPQQINKATKTLLEIAKYQIEVWNN